MKTFQIDVPRFGITGKPRIVERKHSNAKILAMVEQLNSDAPKCVAIDFDVSIGYLYRLRKEYVAKDGQLYRRVDDGN